jgi:alanine dehydrogenase
VKRLWAHYGAALQTVFSTADAIERHVERRTADRRRLIAGAAAPKLVTRAMIARMQPARSSSMSRSTRAVLRDVASDDARRPTYIVDGVVHYCVANMPGGVPRTSTYALNNVTLPYVIAIADKGWKRALADDVHLRQGLNVALGKVTCRPVADAHGFAWTDAAALSLIDSETSRRRLRYRFTPAHRRSGRGRLAHASCTCWCEGRRRSSAPASCLRRCRD